MENPEKSKQNQLSTITFILGIVQLPIYTLVLNFSLSNKIKSEYLFFFWPLVAIGLMIMSISALVQVNKKKEKGRGLAIAAVVLSCLGLVGSIMPILIILLYTFLG